MPANSAKMLFKHFKDAGSLLVQILKNLLFFFVGDITIGVDFGIFGPSYQALGANAKS